MQERVAGVRHFVKSIYEHMEYAKQSNKENRATYPVFRSINLPKGRRICSLGR